MGLRFLEEEVPGDDDASEDVPTNENNVNDEGVGDEDVGDAGVSGEGVDVDGVEDFDCVVTGSGNAKIFYTMLFPTSDGYDHLLYPEFRNLGGTEFTGPINDDDTDIVQYNSGSTQFVRHAFTRFNNSRNQFGGPHVWNRVGTYRKVYYGPVVNNPAQITRLKFRTSREFGRGKY